MLRRETCHAACQKCIAQHFDFYPGRDVGWGEGGYDGLFCGGLVGRLVGSANRRPGDYVSGELIFYIIMMEKEKKKNQEK